MITGLRRSTLAVGLLVVALLIVACDPATEDPTPASRITSPTAASASASPSATPDGDDDSDDDGDDVGEETSVFELDEQDCFDAAGSEVETVTVVACESPHTYEVFAIFDHEADDDDPYPGDEAILEYADSRCQPLFEDYVGIDYESSIYWITSVTPSDETWESGDDREIVCALKLGEEGDETSGSAEGTGQ